MPTADLKQEKCVLICQPTLPLFSVPRSTFNDHPQDPKIVAIVDRWSLFKGHLCYERPNWDLKKVVVIDK